MAGNPLDYRPDAERLRVEAIGEPGQRRFRLMAVVDGSTYVVWMEKQQLQALGLALGQLLEQLPDRGPELGTPSVPGTFDLQTHHQFRVGRMELGYDERQDRLVLVAHDVAEEDDDIAVSFAFTRTQGRELSVDAATVVAAGRPRCTMCGDPMDPGAHVCPQMNGHLPLAFDETEEDDA